MSQPITLVMADDSDVYREGFAAAIAKFSDLCLLATAANGRELIAEVNRQPPDLVVTDIKMPVMDGIEACRQLSQTHPHIGVVALTMYHEKWLVADMLQAGARGFLLKNVQPADIRHCLHKVYSGGTEYCASSTPVVQALLTGQQNRQPFTENEIRIMQLISEGLDSQQIAAQMFLSKHSIDMYRRSLLVKCGVSNTAALVMYAVRNGIVSVD